MSSESSESEKPIDPALADAITTIGQLIETGENPDALAELATVLRHLAYIATLTASARRYRLTGRILRAVQDERRIEQHYEALPKGAKW